MSIHAVLREELDRAKAAAGDATGPASRAEPRWDRPGRPARASGPTRPVEACVTVGSQAPLLYTFDALDALPYDEADPPRLEMPWLNIYDSRDFLSFVAEPLFRRSDGLASVVDLRVHSDRDFPASHSAYWEQAPVWDAIATRLRVAPDGSIDGPRGAAARASKPARQPCRPAIDPGRRGTEERPGRARLPGRAASRVLRPVVSIPITAIRHAGVAAAVLGRLVPGGSCDGQLSARVPRWLDARG